MSAATLSVIPAVEAEQSAKSPEHHPHRLGQWSATSICGNDILSSCLYVSGIAIVHAGVYAPLILLAIGFVLLLYKKVYTEVVEMLPVNGGAYNCLLNSTRKLFAALAGVMTFLSYIATAVISAKVGSEYLLRILPHAVELALNGFAPLTLCGVPEDKHAATLLTVGVLLMFAILNIAGMKDSARVALFIFLAHIFVLLAFIGAGAWYWYAGNESHFLANSEFTSKLVESAANTVLLDKPEVKAHGGIWLVVFYAFSASLLGVSGFESSANFVEEQERGVFRKTLRNMLLTVTFFNPLIALVVLNGMPFATIAASSDFLLADAALAVGGNPLKVLICVDAFLVLSGAVLTSYVGVSGLLSRMAIDGCFPQYFGKKNSRDAYTRIIVAFFLLCASILIVTKAELMSLAGVYTIAFLGVMSLFAIGNLALKIYRPTMKRTYRAPVTVVVMAAICTLAGMVGNVLIDPRNPMFFATYFLPTAGVMIVIAFRDTALRFLLVLMQPVLRVQQNLEAWLKDTIQEEFIVFIRNPLRLAAILKYIETNETGKTITIVRCLGVNETPDIQAREVECIRRIIVSLTEGGFCADYKLEVVCLELPFGPGAVEKMVTERKVPRNRVFIGSLPTTYPGTYDELGGARTIFS